MKPDFTQNLLLWHENVNNRVMPWKGEKNPYRVWLSEVILQQTRVDQGLSYYNNFVNAYPDVESLARAPEYEVFKLWEGLGYYSRCRNLISTARYIADSLGGRFPEDYSSILALRGIGPYTAAAISSFAFNLPVAVVDGNVQRVLARYFGISTPVDSTAGKKLFNQMAQALIDVSQPAKYNQAIMDFGATICKPRNPLCTICVQAADCEAFRHGAVDQLPVKEKALKMKSRWLYYFILRHHDIVYIRKRNERDIWQDLHEFYLHESEGELAQPEVVLQSGLLSHHSYILEHSSKLFKQQLSHQRIQGRFYVITLDKPVTIPGGYLAVHKSNLNAYAFPRYINAFLESYAI